MTEYFSFLVPFLIAHVICDFYLQPNAWVTAKKEKKLQAPELYKHSLLHGMTLLLPAMYWGLNWRSMVCLVIVVSVTHFFIDLWKVSVKNGHKLSYFLLDQALHVIVLAIIAYHMTSSSPLTSLVEHKSFGFLIVAGLGYLAILKPTSILIGNVLSCYPITSKDPNDEDGTKEINGIVSGGELIGYLERALILTFTLVGSYAAVGFVMAAKSVFRFGELSKAEHRNLTEYVLIGTFLSVVITTLVGITISQVFELIGS